MKSLFLILGILVISMGASAQDKFNDYKPSGIQCVQEQLYTVWQVDEINFGKAVNVLYCSFKVELGYAYGANFLEVTSAAIDQAERSIEKSCEQEDLVFGRYNIRGMAKGGIENFIVENRETQSSVVATISGNYYCIPDDFVLYRR